MTENQKQRLKPLLKKLVMEVRNELKEDNTNEIRTSAKNFNLAFYKFYTAVELIKGKEIANELFAAYRLMKKNVINKKIINIDSL